MDEVKIRLFDAANYLETDDDIAEYLRFVREANDQQLLEAAVSPVTLQRNNPMTVKHHRPRCQRTL